ncbi:hypothetical protein [Trichormus azollae]|uniref:hypothetical protein n=1 Tax=Trichormus azollae TaxID=1164 RepID=UPI003D345CAC
MDYEGNVTYLNPAASLKFPRLREIVKEHVILVELLHAVANQKDKSFVGEVEV